LQIKQSTGFQKLLVVVYKALQKMIPLSEMSNHRQLTLYLISEQCVAEGAGYTHLVLNKTSYDYTTSSSPFCSHS